MLLAILPSEERTDLGEAGFPGLTAVWRPMSLTEKAAWFDHCKGDIDTADAKVHAVRQQLLRVDGLEVEDLDGARAPLDPANPAHFGALPMGLVLAVYVAVITRTALAEQTRKN